MALFLIWITRILSFRNYPGFFRAGPNPGSIPTTKKNYFLSSFLRFQITLLLNTKILTYIEFFLKDKLQQLYDSFLLF